MAKIEKLPQNDTEQADYEDPGMTPRTPESVNKELDEILEEEGGHFDEVVHVTDEVQETTEEEMQELQERATEAGVNEDEQAEIDTHTEALSSKVQEEKTGLMQELFDVDPDTLKKTVDEHAEFLRDNAGMSVEEFTEHFTLDPDSGNVYFSLAKTFGRKAETQEKTEDDPQEPTGEAAQEQAPEQNQEAGPEHIQQGVEDASETPAESPDDTPKDRPKRQSAVRKAEIFGQSENRHLNRTAEQIGEFRLQQAIRKRVRNMAHGYNSFMASDYVMDLRKALFGKAKVQQPYKISDPDALARLAGKLATHKKGITGGIFNYFKGWMGIDQTFARVGRKIARAPLTAGHTVRAKVDDMVTAGANHMERPLAEFGLHRAQAQERAAMKHLESGRSTDSERVQRLLRRVRILQRRLDRINRRQQKVTR